MLDALILSYSYVTVYTNNQSKVEMGEDSMRSVIMYKWYARLAFVLMALVAIYFFVDSDVFYGALVVGILYLWRSLFLAKKAHKGLLLAYKARIGATLLNLFKTAEFGANNSKKSLQTTRKISPVILIAFIDPITTKSMFFGGFGKDALRRFLEACTEATNDVSKAFVIAVIKQKLEDMVRSNTFGINLLCYTLFAGWHLRKSLIHKDSLQQLFVGNFLIYPKPKA